MWRWCVLRYKHLLFCYYCFQYIGKGCKFRVIYQWKMFWKSDEGADQMIYLCCLFLVLSQQPVRDEFAHDRGRWWRACTKVPCGWGMVGFPGRVLSVHASAHHIRNHGDGPLLEPLSKIAFAASNAQPWMYTSISIGKVARARSTSTVMWTFQVLNCIDFKLHFKLHYCKFGLLRQLTATNYWPGIGWPRVSWCAQISVISISMLAVQSMQDIHVAMFTGLIQVGNPVHEFASN